MKPDAPSRFWAKVEKADGCWLWIGAVGRGGYGNFWDGERHLNAHRFVFILEHGAIPDSHEICHHCDTRRCVNPDHLFLGTRTENMADMDAKGRRRTPSHHGESNPNARLTAQDVLAIRRLRPRGAARLAMARQYGVSKSTIYRILAGTLWRQPVIEAILLESEVAA